jgi:hypothetical protein
LHVLLKYEVCLLFQLKQRLRWVEGGVAWREEFVGPGGAVAVAVSIVFVLDEPFLRIRVHEDFKRFVNRLKDCLLERRIIDLFAEF